MATGAFRALRFAIIDGLRMEAAPGRSGQCPGCGSVVSARCGTRKIWHWAHEAIRACDPWWEPETEWHRGWKSLFPSDQQEVRHRAASGEWHIADVRTRSGAVIEFQHSAMRDEERRSRDDFYDRLVWVVDGSAMKRAAKRFERWLGPSDTFRDYHRHDGTELHAAHGADLPEQWLSSPHPVVFDFRNHAFECQNHREQSLWALCPTGLIVGPFLKRLTREDITGIDLSDPADPFGMRRDIMTIMSRRHSGR